MINNPDLVSKLINLINVSFPDKPDYDTASELLVIQFEKDYKIYSTREDVSPELWIYDGGIYIPKGKTYIEEFCREYLGKLYTSSIMTRVYHKIKADSYIDPDKFFSSADKENVAVKNGILNIFTRELTPFTPDKIFFNKMPVYYDSSKKCPLIDSHFKEVLKKPDDKKVLYELIGYCLEQTHFIEKAFMFVGDGRNGKGKTLELIKRLVGVESCSSVPLSSMREDSFNLWQIFGKKVNLAGDLNNTDLKNTGLFKSITGRDLITAHRKFMSDLIFVSTCKNIFACNELPKVYDLSKGFWSRWILLEFPYEFMKKEDYDKLDVKDRKYKKIIDPEHIDKITTDDELSGLLNEALDGLDRLRENKDFSYSVGTNEVKEMWVRRSNSFMAFCMDCISEKEGSSITKADIRKYFLRYCKEFKLKGAGDREIKATLEDLYGVGESRTLSSSNEWVHTWTGIVYQDYHDKMKSPKIPIYKNQKNYKKGGNGGKLENFIPINQKSKETSQIDEDELTE